MLMMSEYKVLKSPINYMVNMPTNNLYVRITLFTIALKVTCIVLLLFVLYSSSSKSPLDCQQSLKSYALLFYSKHSTKLKVTIFKIFFLCQFVNMKQDMI